jgi:peptidoglycan DL-endopeptidase CwlO
LRFARRLLFGVLAAVVAATFVAPTSVAHAAPSLTQQIDELSNKLELVAEQYDGLVEQLKADKAKQTQLQAGLQAQQAGLDAANAGVAQIARRAYINGTVSSAAAVLDARTPEQFIDVLGSLNSLARAQQGQLATYRNVSATYQAQKAKLDQVVAQESTKLTQLTAQKAAYNGELKHLYALRQAAYGSATEKPGAGAYTGSIPYYPGRAGVAVKFAYSQLGAPYNFGEAGPYSTGYDCSGLTMAAWAKAGVSLYHQARVQWTQVTHISQSQLQPGDLAFYNDLGHVAIYVGNGQMIEAPHAGVNVRKVPLRTGAYGFGRPH